MVGPAHVLPNEALQPTYFAPRRFISAIMSVQCGNGSPLANVMPEYSSHDGSSPGGLMCEQMSVKWMMIGSAASRKHGAPQPVSRHMPA